MSVTSLCPDSFIINGPNCVNQLPVHCPSQYIPSLKKKEATSDLYIASVQLAIVNNDAHVERCCGVYTITKIHTVSISREEFNCFYTLSKAHKQRCGWLNALAINSKWCHDKPRYLPVNGIYWL